MTVDVYKKHERDGLVVHEMRFGDVVLYVSMEHDRPRDWPMVAGVFARSFCAKLAANGTGTP